MSLWFRDDSFPDIGNANEIARDWARQPLVGITVTRDESCPTGSEAIFFRPWLGTDTYCICEGTIETPERHYRGECIGYVYSN